MLPPFSHVWNRIVASAGQPFSTSRGLPFTYTTSPASLRTSRTRYSIGRTEIEKAYAHVPFNGPGDITKTVRGPSYVWAILHDRRIRRTDW